MKRPRTSPSVNSNSGIQSRRQFKHTKHPHISTSITKLFNAVHDETNRRLRREMLASESSSPAVSRHHSTSLNLAQHHGNSDGDIFDDDDPPDRPLPLYSSAPYLVSSKSNIFHRFEYLPSPETTLKMPSFSCYAYYQGSTLSSIDIEPSRTFGNMQISTEIERRFTTKSGMPALFGIYRQAAIAPVKFMFFPMLPAELRIRVWHFALPRRRVVQLMYRPHGCCRFRSHAHIPQSHVWKD
ncbi:hypothetical protein IFR05_001892 [Cadophora sp. M221]|nr:hypothetical protein IFR05_001892 [Cadophora sp. M221]